MPILEEGFQLLYWPPLVKESKWIAAHPGYEYIKFKNYQELDEYFVIECGPHWRKQEWAEYWFGQHAESVRADRREQDHRNGIFPKTRKDLEPVYTIAKSILEQSPFLSCRKLTYILHRRGIRIQKSTVAKFIKRFKNEESL